MSIIYYDTDSQAEHEDQRSMERLRQAERMVKAVTDTERLDWILAQFANGATVFEGIWTREDIDAGMERGIIEIKCPI